MVIFIDVSSDVMKSLLIKGHSDSALLIRMLSKQLSHRKEERVKVKTIVWIICFTPSTT